MYVGCRKLPSSWNVPNSLLPIPAPPYKVVNNTHRGWRSQAPKTLILATLAETHRVSGNYLRSPELFKEVRSLKDSKSHASVTGFTTTHPQLSIGEESRLQTLFNGEEIVRAMIHHFFLASFPDINGSVWHRMFTYSHTWRPISFDFNLI